MRRTTAVIFAILPLVLGGCAALERSTLRTEARQLAWTGPGAGPCLFGGVTARADEHCARINFGVEGVLYAVNGQVRAQLGSDRNCERHVAAAQRALAHHADLRTEPVYSCPAGARARGECHVSLLVTTIQGERYVLDNGAVVRDTVGAHGVAAFTAFAGALDGIVWVGEPPSAQEVADAIPGFRPEGILSARR